LTSLDATACKHKRDGCNSALIDADQRMIERTDLALDLAECETRLPASLQALSDDLRTLSISEAARKANLPRSTLRDRALKLRSVYKRAGLDIYLPE